MKSHQQTRFPGLEKDQTKGITLRGVNSDTNRQTRFPGGTEIQKMYITETDGQDTKIPMEIEEAARVPFPIPLRINPPDGPSVRAQPTKSVTQREQPPLVKIESPWNRYTSLRSLERGVLIIAACMIRAPVQMVAVKQLAAYNFEKLGISRHENLLAVIEVYRFQNSFIITDYTATTLRQVIAIPLQIEENHVLEGMQYLSKFDLAHKHLDSSRILFSSDGCAKIAHFDECQSTESASARSLGVIAIEMMQNGIAPETDGKLVLMHPERWSPEASNFLEVTSWGTLTDINKNKFLKYVSPTVMIPFIEYAHWDTIESLI
ncbi:hypothetical protein BKA65DRAFT_543563 [Rhexocercosporidium sp. MPI-PUGE-AT-0058]|nr:hypothetical protein BKA65DRAFT_543563 [Rhexocercosporidium sp. MPI-PUGE-AT-0058]